MGVIYLSRCKVNGKGYVGETVDFERRKRWHKEDAEKGESWLFQKAIRKYGWDAFEWSILYQDDDNDKDWMSWWERKFIRELGTKMPNGYNMTDGGDGGDTMSGRHHTPESIEKMRKSQKIACRTRKKRVGCSDEARKNMSLAQTGRKVSTEHRKKISETLLGYKHTEESKQKMSLAGRGKKKTEEHKAKIAASHIGIGLGSKHTEEAKQKISESLRKLWIERKSRYE